MRLYIREAREKVGVTQAQLARFIGVSPSTLNGYEMGKHDPKSEHLIKIAEACGVTVDYLLGVEKETAPPPEYSQEARHVLDAFNNSPGNVRAAIMALLCVSGEDKD